MTKPRTALRLVLFAACALAALVFLRRFPWREIPVVLARANPGILWLALAVNLVSLIAKGTAWHFLVRLSAPCRWRAAQEANFVGAAMNTLSVSVIGETARVQDLAAREGISVGSVAASVVRARAIEALALACFMLLAPTVLHLPLLRDLQIAGGCLLLALLAAAWSGKSARVLNWMPTWFRAALSSVTGTVPAQAFVPALLFALLNWVSQWATYHLTLTALRIPVPISGSFTALIVTNLSGLFRLSPGNVGVTQAAMMVSLLPFGVRPHEAIAAGFALQAIQLLPVLALALLMVGRRGFAGRAARERSKSDTSSVHMQMDL